MNDNSGMTQFGRDGDQVDKVCDIFEAAWQRNDDPQIENYLGLFPPQARQMGFAELIRVELELRRKNGQTPSASDYLQRFPQYTSTIESLLPVTGAKSGFAAKTDPAATQAFASDAHRGSDVLLATDQAPSQRNSISDVGRTVEHTPRSRKESRGLHIRCPHCHNPVELLTDTPYTEVSCDSCGSMFSLVSREEATQAATPLKTIARFDLISRLGMGGFGTVWKARDQELDRVVAVKIPRRGQLSEAEVEQFFREARSAAQLRHPNIVPVHEVGREDETLFIVSDFIRGVTLSDWLTANQPTSREVASLLVPITQALQHAHEQGIVHRDLKPSNIMIDESGRPYLMDFGLAKREVGEITMTIDGQIVGTPRYMSPEQAAGRSHSADGRTDIYSLGVMLFELLTGESPFRGNAQMQIHQRLIEDAPDPRKLNRHVPKDLATICLKCMEREPSRRFQSAGTLEREFNRFLRGEPIESRPISAPARIARWAKRKPMIASTAALTIFLAIAGPTAALLIHQQRTRLEQLVLEKNNLISQYAVKTREVTNQLTSVSDQLAVWEGKANPWKFWPPYRVASQRLTVLNELFKHAKKRLSSAQDTSESTSEQIGRVLLSLAIIADVAGNKSDAKSYYERAQRILKDLLDKNPGDARLARALAESQLDAARLLLDEDRGNAQKQLAQANSLYRTLGDANAASSIARVGLLETELLLATLVGFEAGQEHLAKSELIAKQLQDNWPTDPDKIYVLACRLAGREPVLSATTESID